MREIKFRAWHPETKTYVCFSNAKCEKDIYQAAWFFRLAQEGKLEQYTGLKDKNGVEIYEGDKIKAVNEHENRSLRGVVDFMWGGFFLRTESQLIFLSEITNSDFEIIGNIHEL